MEKRIVRCLFGVILLLQGSLLFAQDPAEAYFNYADRNDCDQEWDSFVLSGGNQKPRKPNIELIPVADKQSVSSYAIHVTEIIDTLPAVWSMVTTDSMIDEIDLEDQDMRTVRFDFYGVTQLVSVPKELGEFHPKGILEKDIAEFNRSLSRCKYRRIISDCNKYRVALGYNDWAVLKWMQTLAGELYPENMNGEQEIFTVFMLEQMGLSVKVARADSRLAILFASMQEIYARQYIHSGTSTYYLVENLASGTKIFTYDVGYGKPTRPLDLRVATPLRLGQDSSKEVTSRYSSVWNTTLNVPVSNSLVGFYSDYPQMDAKFYASAALSQEFVNVFKPFVTKGTSATGKVNELLSFLQRDFRYMIDQEQFEREKPFFCEENFVYSYNDCEDRSILLSSLIRNILGLKVVLLDYKEHMAIAVCLDEPVKGDHLVLDNQKYYVCDPTYIGASIGMSMPQYKNKPVTVYRL